jgi:hypothetical protein
MLPRIAGLALATLLALPAAALAAEPKSGSTCRDGAEMCIQPVDPRPVEPGPVAPRPAGRYFYIAAIERGGTAVKVEGKLWIEGGQLGASVGCNSIGGRATFDGRTLTTGDLITTEMACEGPLAETERALVAALTAGPFTWNGSAFTGKGVTIQASEAGTTPAVPPDAPISDPDAPVSKPGGPGPVAPPDPGFDLEACRPFIPEDAWQAVFGPFPGPGGGSGNVGSGSSGSGGASSGGGGGSIGIGSGEQPVTPPVTVDPVPPPVTVDPAPPATPVTEPNPGATTAPITQPAESPAPAPTPAGESQPTPGPEEGPMPSAEPDGTPAPDASPVPNASPAPDASPAPNADQPNTNVPTIDSGVTLIAPQVAEDQPVAIDLPATTDLPAPTDLPATTEPGEAQRLPLKVVDGPAPTPSAETCREMLAKIRTLAVGAPMAPSMGGDAETASTRDFAADDAASVGLNPLAALALVLIAGGLVVAWLRTIPGRREPR